MLGVLAAHAKDLLHQLAGTSAATVLLALVVIAFLIPQLRRYVLVLICFGVCVFSVERAWEGVGKVRWTEAVWTDYAFVTMWLSIAFFSGLAGVGEVWCGSPRWSQQSYLMAVALYFLGHAGAQWLREQHLSALFFLMIGLVALGGVWWIGANRIAQPQPVSTVRRRRVRWIQHLPSSGEHTDRVR
ncbi:MAG: hypothetical protein RMK92_11100 [Armatimonadota bacterium]|nr:hypothetical protein [Armatimonadota bacterium]